MKKFKKKNILVDMTASFIHHGHIRLLRKASKLGTVIVALTKDSEIIKHKKFYPPLNFNQRKEILIELNCVKKVIKSNYKITQNFLDKHKIDLIVNGSDYKNRKFLTKSISFPRTKNINSSIMRKKLLKGKIIK